MFLIRANIENLFCFEKVEVELTNNIYLISGINLDENGFDSNGSGKTSFIHSIYWCLFGKAMDKRDGEEILKLNTEKGYCELLFSNGLKIRRSINNKGTKKLIVFLNKDELTCDTVTKTQEKIDELIECDAKTFIYSNVMSSDFSNAFIGKDTSPSERFATFNKLIDYELLDKCSEFCKKAITNTKEGISNVQGKIEGFSSILNSIDEKEINEKLVTIKSQTNDTELSLSAIKDKIEYMAKLQSKNKEYENYLITVVEKEKCQNKLINVNTHLGASEPTDKLNDTLYELKQQFKETDDKLKGNNFQPCPHCNKPLTIIGTNIAKFEKETYNKEELKESKDLLETKIKELQVMLSKISELKNEKVYLETKIESLTIAEIDKPKPFNAEEMNTLKKEEYTLTTTLRTAVSEKASLEEKLNLLNSVKTQYDDFIEKLKMMNGKLSTLIFWKEGFSSIKMDQINNIIPAFEDEVNNILRQYFDFSSEVSFQTTKELKKGGEKIELYISIKDSDNIDRSFESMSNGEQSRLAIAVTMARNIIFGQHTELQFLLIDELLDGLDKEGKQRFIDVLKASDNQIFVISHSDEFKNIFTNTLTFVKENGSSKYVNS